MQRVQKNIEEGRGIRFGKGSSQGGVFDFASSNELWRASIEILDFVPFTNVKLLWRNYHYRLVLRKF